MTAPNFFLTPNSILAKVDPATYARGLSVYLNQLVLDYEVSYTSALAWELEGTVQGSHKERYFVTVAIEVDNNGRLSYFAGDCTCPVEVNCKHAVALTVKAAYQAGRGDSHVPRLNLPDFITHLKRPSAPLPPIETAAELLARKQAQEAATHERAKQLAQLKVSQWLDAFGPAPEDALDTERSAAPAALLDDHMVYLLTTATQDNLPVLQLGYAKSHRLRNGKWAKAKIPSYLDENRLPRHDQEVVSLIQSQIGRSGGYYGTVSKATLRGETGRLALQMAAATGFLFAPVEDRVLTEPVQLGPARHLNWDWAHTEATAHKEATWTLQAALAADPAVLGPSQAQWFANQPPLYLDCVAGLCGAVEAPGLTAAHLTQLLKAPPMPQSVFALQETRLLSRLSGVPLPPVLTPPKVVQDVAPTAHLLITQVAAHNKTEFGLLSASLHFDYDGLTFYRRSTQSPMLVDAIGPAGSADKPARVLLYRDLVREQTAHEHLTRMGLSGNAYGVFHRFPPHSQQMWLEWTDHGFTALSEAGFTVNIDPDLDDWIARADTLDVTMNPGREGDENGVEGGDEHGSISPWFDLSLGMQINGERHNILPLLPDLLAQLSAARQGENSEASTAQLPPFVYLHKADGGYLRLPTEPLRPWLQALLDLVGDHDHDLTGDSLRLSRLEALRIGAALGQGVQWSGADSLRQMVTQLAGHAELPIITLPAGLNAQLRPYQQHGLNWLQFLCSHGLAGILADDMGLGKTLQTLAHLLVEKQAGRLDRPALVIAPVSLMGNWRREAARFTPALKTLVLHGADRHEVAGDIAQHDLVIAPYSLLQRDRERWVNQPWHIVVLDEAQNIKNANSYAAQVASELNTRHRLCLSGTPMENHLGELWSLFHFLMPGFLGSQQRFKDLFRTPIEKDGNNERLEQLRRRVTPFMLRRAKKDVATDLPPKQEFVSSVELGDKQANLYETIRLTTEKAVREALTTKGLAKSQIQVLDALLKLRQVCCDPRLVPLAAAKKIKQSAKLELLMELLPEMLAEGRRILLFSQFTSMLALIEEELKARSIPWVKLTGQSQKRDALIEQFTSGAVPLFLISLKAGGVGLNLPQADTVIHYDPWWNPATENQATDRAHRIGQTQSVFVYKLVAQGTIEERILALQARKAALADSLYSGSQGRKQPLFTEDDVAELLKPLGG